MTHRVFAFYATCLLFLGKMAGTTAHELSSSLKSVDVGDNVTLECFRQESAIAVMFYWYKQTLGDKPKLVSTFYKHDRNGMLYDDFKDNPRFKLETTDGKNHLIILDVQISDSATYHCVNSYSYVYDFFESITLSVKSSGLKSQSWIHQTKSESIQPGGSVTLNCTVHTGTCDGGHSVYWFRDSEESHPGLIYTHGDRNDTCERNPDTQTHTCVYNLPITNLNHSHTGTYYCAVASCGHILFGNGTKVDFHDKGHSLLLVYSLSGALAINILMVIFLAFTAYKIHKRRSCICTDSQAGSAAASAPNTAVHGDAEDLHYAALREHKASRSRRQRDDSQTECVYSRVKQ